jgi:hypothetical protein
MKGSCWASPGGSELPILRLASVTRVLDHVPHAFSEDGKIPHNIQGTACNSGDAHLKPHRTTAPSLEVGPGRRAAPLWGRPADEEHVAAEAVAGEFAAEVGASEEHVAAGRRRWGAALQQRSAPVRSTLQQADIGEEHVAAEAGAGEEHFVAEVASDGSRGRRRW